MGIQSEIDGFAARQYGVFNTSQLRNAGFDKSAVLRRVQSGAWLRMEHGVYAVASAPPKWERRVAAAVLSRPEAIVTGSSAAYLAGMRGFGRTRPVVYIRSGQNPRSSVARFIQTNLFDEIDAKRIEGFRVTTVPETLLVLAGTLEPSRLESVFDEALLARNLNLKALGVVIDRETGRRTQGLARLRRLADSHAPAAPGKDSSYLEAMLETMLGKHDLPRWSREHSFTLGQNAARVDVYFPQWRLVVEVDGRSWHARTSDFENDRHRDNLLATQGIQVLRFTYEMLKTDSDGVLRTIRHAGSVRMTSGGG